VGGGGGGVGGLPHTPKPPTPNPQSPIPKEFLYFIFPEIKILLIITNLNMI